VGHLSDLILDLGLILMAAAIVTLIFKKLKQPVVLGYLIAGFFVGPHFGWLPSVKDISSITIWAEIGVIFMLFGLGLEFSFKKLSQVGKSASITASYEILFMLGAGYSVGQILDWSKMDSLFLGGILSISSTTIIVRAFEELNLKGKGFVSLVFGVLIVEDLLAILLLVLLSSVAVTQTLSGAELGFSALRLAFFLVVWFLLGIYILPVFLRQFKDYLSDETMLIVSLGLCLMMVIIASKVGFSPALGAFIMGSILAETPKGHRVEQLILPVKNLFSAVFFVSVGMMLDMKVMAEYYPIILLLTVVTIIGKFLSTTVGSIISGRSLKNSVQAGMSLAQIGEFSFIIATLGMTLKVTSGFLYPIAVAVSALTTLTTPYLIQLSDPFYSWIEKKLPSSVKDTLAVYETAMSTNSEENVLSLLWREYGIKIVLNSIVVIAITLGIYHFILPIIGGRIGIEAPIDLIACGLALILTAPFLWAVAVGGPAHTAVYRVTTAEQLRKLQIGISIFRFILGTLLVGFIVMRFTSILAISGIVLVAFAGLGALIFSRFSEPIYHRIESRFISNLTQNERDAMAKNKPVAKLAPWNAVLAEYTMTAYSPLIAKTLQQSQIKEEYGITVAMIERGEQRILAPTRDVLLLPNDKLFLIGTDEQLMQIKEVIERQATAEALPPVLGSFGLTSLTLLPTDPFVNKPIRECGLREAVNGLIVGIEREGERILSPDSAMHLLPRDLVWIVGDKDLIRDLHSTVVSS